MESLHRAVAHSTSSMLDLPTTTEPTDAKSAFARLTILLHLSEALSLIGTDQSLADASICFAEIASLSEDYAVPPNFTCIVCETKALGHRCLTYYTEIFCESGHEKYTSRDKETPDALETKEGLEAQLFAFRLALQPIFSSTYSFSIGGGRLLARIFRMAKGDASLTNCVDSKHQDYTSWAANPNEGGRFLSERRPGLSFLRLVQKTREIDGDDDALDRTAAYTEVGLALEKLEQDHPADQEVFFSRCRQHRFAKIATTDSLSEEERSNFDANGQLKPDYIRRLREKYSAVTGDENLPQSSQDIKISAQQDTAVSVVDVDASESQGQAGEEPAAQ